MATISFENGVKVNFDGTPTQRDIEEVASQLGLSASTSPQKPEGETYGALFPARTDDTPIEAGFKALGNIPSSAFNLGKSVVSAAVHPVDTLKGIGSAAAGGLQKLIPGEQAQEGSFDAFTNFLKERYGSLENLQRTATNDPFGFGSELLGGIGAAAKLAGKGAQLSKAIETAAKPVTAVASKTGQVVKNTTASSARFAASQATGLSPETVSTAIQRAPELTAAQKSGLNRATLGADLQSTIQNRIDHLSDLGKGYEPIRAAETTVTLPEDWFTNILTKHKLSINEGKIIGSKESTVLNNNDISALQAFYDLYAKDPLHTPNSYLNTREALSQLAKYDAAKTGNLQSIARDARTELNRYRNQVSGLKELDDAYSPEVEELKAIKKEWFDSKTGELKDSALTRIANATGKGKDKVLERLETVQPGITKQIQLLKAIEDIENAGGNKVGTYTRAAIAGGGIFTGNIPVIIGAILSQPEIAVPLIKGLGLSKAKLGQLLKPLKEAASDINNLRVPPAVQEYLRTAQPGLSIRDVNGYSGPMHNDQVLIGNGYAGPIPVEPPRNIPHGDRNPAPATKDAWPTTASKPSTAKNTSTGNAPTGKEGVSAQRADTSGPFDAYDILGFTEGAKETLTPIKLNGRVVGGVEATPTRYGDPDTLRVHNIRILPEAQGKGLGTQAINQLFKDNPHVNRLVGNATAEARPFWEKIGAKFSDDSTHFTITRPSPSIPKELEPLAAEARKYKSAEEFAKALENETGAIADHAFKVKQRELLGGWGAYTGQMEGRPPLGKSSKLITVYRGVPEDASRSSLTYGDMVSTSKTRAAEYGSVQSFQVPENKLLKGSKDGDLFYADETKKSHDLFSLTDFFNRVKGLPDKNKK